jgi:hypothetical protein
MRFANLIKTSLFENVGLKNVGLLSQGPIFVYIIKGKNFREKQIKNFLEQLEDIQKIMKIEN